MKKLILIVVVVLCMLPVLASAEGTEAKTTSDTKYTGSCPYINDYLNGSGLLDHEHNLPKVKKFQSVAGMNIVTFESKGKKVKLTTNYRFNLETKVHTLGPVVEVDLWGFFNKDK